MSEGKFEIIAEAFSRTAEKYDRFAEDHPNLSRIRTKVYRHFQRYADPGSRVLELNAGTGTDAVYLANQGYYVHATDISSGMLDRIQSKTDQMSLGDRLSVQLCSFTELDKVKKAPFDAVFSNLGGLNCIPDLRQIIRSLPQILRPGGLVTWVLMPPICLWELGMLLKGHTRYALRRLSPNGTRAHLEGMYFTIHYFSPSRVAQSFGPRYKLLSIEGLSIFAPPAESKNLARKHPRLYRALCWLDDRVCKIPPWRGWGDFYIVSLRFEPGRD